MTVSVNNNKISPIVANQRIKFLDVLRGVAILFIFMANILSFSGFFSFPDDALITGLVFPFDEVLDFIIYTLVDGKFYSIFSLLFGIGCAMQFNKLGNNKSHFAFFFRKRMFWLLIIGLIHLCLFWLGDILALYALLGFVLIWFVNSSNKNLIKFGIILILFPIINWLFVHLTKLNYAEFFFNLNTSYYEYYGLPLEEWEGNKYADFQQFIANESLSDYFKYNIGNTFIRIGAILEEGRIFKVLGIFLIGLWVGRKILNEDLLNNVKFLKKVAFWGIIIGLPISTFRTYIEFFGGREDLWGFLKTVAYAFGTVPLALGIAALLALWYRKSPNGLNIFAPVGKMALSNYIFQTFIAVIIFYGIGFGFAGKFGFTVIMGIAILIFILQIIISKLWLQHYKFGPIEWVWRQLTYGKKITISQPK